MLVNQPSLPFHIHQNAMLIFRIFSLGATNYLMQLIELSHITCTTHTSISIHSEIISIRLVKVGHQLLLVKRLALSAHCFDLFHFNWFFLKRCFYYTRAVLIWWYNHWTLWELDIIRNDTTYLAMLFIKIAFTLMTVWI